MKGKRGISLWLLAVYLVATAALSVATLTCECAVHAGGGDSACCTHCSHHVPEHDGALTGACCCDLHSMELSLAVLIHFWDSPDRATVAWVIAAVWVAAWGGVLWALVSALGKSRSPFVQTRAELARDWQSFKEKL